MSQHNLNDGAFVLEIFIRGKYLKNVLLEVALLRMSLRKFSGLESTSIGVREQNIFALSTLALINRDALSKLVTQHVKILLEAIVLSDYPLELLSLFSLDLVDLSPYRNPHIWFNSYALS
jgi:hypothetical protein